MIIIDWLKWKWYTLRYNFAPMKTSDGRWIVACFDHWNKSSFNASGRLLSKKNAEELAEKLRSFKTFRDSKTEEGRGLMVRDFVSGGFTPKDFKRLYLQEPEPTPQKITHNGDIYVRRDVVEHIIRGSLGPKEALTKIRSL